MTNSRTLIAAMAATLLLAFSQAALLGQDRKPPAEQLPVERMSADELVAVLQSDVSPLQKTLACKRLARIGGGDVVPVLAPLLSDEQLSHGARIALEAIPDPAAAQALRDAASTVKGKLLVGVINSIGARRDHAATEVLGRLLADADPEVAIAATAALGKIASPQAAQIVEQALSTASDAVRPALAGAGLACAEAMAAQGKRGEAATLYNRLRKMALPKHIRAAATRGAILAAEASGLDLLIAQLQAEDDALFASALGVSRDLPGSEVTTKLVSQLSELSPERQALLIAALADRRERAALPAVLERTTSENLDVRIAATEALATLGDVSAVPLLLESLGHSDMRIATAALGSLASMGIPEVDAAIVSKLDEAKGQSRRLLLELAGRRRVVLAADALAQAAEDREEGIRLAALQGLGMISGVGQLPVLTRHLLTPTSPGDRDAAQEALRATCARLAGNNACAEHLVGCLAKASPESKNALIELLAIIAGPTALEAVVAAARDQNVEIQDTATRVLGEWPDPEAAPPLLKLARELDNGKFRIRVLRGCIRIIRQMDLPDQQKLTMCRQAMDTAQRDDERKLALEAVGRIPTTEAMSTALSHADPASLREAACAAVVSIAESIAASEPEAAAKAMERVLHLTKDADTRLRASDALQKAQSSMSRRP
jgi:HEAT repeat protein